MNSHKSSRINSKHPLSGNHINLRSRLLWNLRRVVHLHRRAGFAATWNEIQRDLTDGPDASIDRILNGSSREETGPAIFEKLAKTIADAAVRSNQPDRLKAWWLYRMMYSSRPLTEKLTLLWHNHFATSNRKLEDLSLMRQQNELFRTRTRSHRLVSC